MVDLVGTYLFGLHAHVYSVALCLLAIEKMSNELITVKAKLHVNSSPAHQLNSHLTSSLRHEAKSFSPFPLGLKLEQLMISTLQICPKHISNDY